MTSNSHILNHFQHLILLLTISFLTLTLPCAILYTVVNSSAFLLLSSLPPPNPKGINSHHSEPQALTLCPQYSHWKSHLSPLLLPLPPRNYFQVSCLQFYQTLQRILSGYSRSISNETSLKFILFLSPSFTYFYYNTTNLPFIQSFFTFPFLSSLIIQSCQITFILTLGSISASYSHLYLSALGSQNSHRRYDQSFITVFSSS